MKLSEYAEKEGAKYQVKRSFTAGKIPDAYKGKHKRIHVTIKTQQTLYGQGGSNE